ncbi:MAG TPA: HD domain-containing protein [Tepidiformaceae bacterium]|nr:HD domain-containing protein [Tepidiformaceae bacterium]HMO94803.1 HD domain-containing protein [Tepidiformaceae bacterium]
MLVPFTTTEEAWRALEEQGEWAEGEGLNLFEHGLQTAEGLEAAGAAPDVIVAGLLHDLGDGRVSSAEHAPWAAELVRPLFGERVAWLIAAHAEAKRYIVTTEPAYHATLSPVSQQTLIEQGGVMTDEEVREFESHPWAKEAVLLRQCDDAGKRRDYEVPDRERFRTMLDLVAARSAIGG